jgi:hypothetical protein
MPPMSLITVAGPPRRAEQARIGFPFLMPLNTTPPADWAASFEAQDWTTVDMRLRPPYHPRLEGDLVWLPGIEIEELVPIVDAIVERIEAIDADYVARLEAHERAQAESVEQHAERVAREQEILDQWWGSRPKPL